jgi:hypothetical protein
MILERKFCVHVLFQTPWHLSKKGRSSHILPRRYHDGRCRQTFLTKLLRKKRTEVLPMTPKQSDRVLNGLVTNLLLWRKWNSKVPTLRS